MQSHGGVKHLMRLERGQLRIRPVPLAGLLAIGLTGFLIVVGCSANRMVFQPWTAMEASPADLKRPCEDIFFSASDGVRLNGWFFSADTNVAAGFVILLCHGNAGNLSHRLPIIDMLLKAGASVFAFDYRGYGRSSGKPSEKGVCLDAEAAWQWLRDHGFAAMNIVALGESLGGGVVCELATRKPIAGMILQSTFTSVPDVASELMPWLPVRLLVTTRFDNHAKLKRLQVPVLFLHGRKDTIIPFRHAQKNFATAKAPKYFAELDGDHNDALTASPEKYQRAVAEFLTKLAQRNTN
jgi:fermentation-respiration switch protein FrsA (DUF1100 family)